MELIYVEKIEMLFPLSTRSNLSSLTKRSVTLYLNSLNDSRPLPLAVLGLRQWPRALNNVQSLVILHISPNLGLLSQ